MLVSIGHIFSSNIDPLSVQELPSGLFLHKDLYNFFKIGPFPDLVVFVLTLGAFSFLIRLLFWNIHLLPYTYQCPAWSSKLKANIL